MNLRLNPAHPLCQPSRNLVFATFGTGAGAQVLDLADQPSHGVIRDEFAIRQTVRSLQSTVPPGFPADYSALTFRNTSATFSGVEFGSTTKVSGVTDNFSVAIWVRPWAIGGDCWPLSTGNNDAGGFSLLSSTGVGGRWAIVTNRPSIDGTVVNAIPVVRQWSLLCVTYTTSRNPRLSFFTNGAAGAIYQQDNSLPEIVPGSRLTIGRYDDGAGGTQVGNCDIGPCLFWNSVLSPDDVALLYRDTWGMVTRPRLRLIESGGGGGGGGGASTLSISPTRRRR